MGHVSMYYTEEEPPIELIGKKRHFFAKPSIKGIAAVTGGARNDIAEDDQAMFGNNETFEALKKIYMSPLNLRAQL